MHLASRLLVAGYLASLAAIAVGLAVTNSAVQGGVDPFGPMPAADYPAWIDGDWATMQPGLTLVALGLAAAGILGLVLVVVTPLGRLRLLAVPPGLFVLGGWLLWLAFGARWASFDLATILVNVGPGRIVAMTVATLLILTPFGVRALVSLARRGLIPARRS